jgi:hypothetical protein
VSPPAARAAPPPRAPRGSAPAAKTPFSHAVNLVQSTPCRLSLLTRVDQRGSTCATAPSRLRSATRALAARREACEVTPGAEEARRAAALGCGRPAARARRSVRGRPVWSVVTPKQNIDAPAATFALRRLHPSPSGPPLFTHPALLERHRRAGSSTMYGLLPPTAVRTRLFGWHGSARFNGGGRGGSKPGEK